VEAVSANERRRRFAKIELPIPVVNPIVYDLLCEIGGSYVKNLLDSLMRDEQSILYESDGNISVTTNKENIPKNSKTWERTDAIYELVRWLSETLSNDGYEEWTIIKDNLDKLIINEVIVLPPDLRPASPKARNSNQVDKINRYYMQILTKKEAMENTILNINKDKQLYYNYYRQLQKDINELYVNILAKLAKKEGLIRGNILGKRIDFSGRAVIAPEPTLELDECILPYTMFLELFKLKISKKLIEQETFKILNDAIDYIDKCIDYNYPVLFDLCQEMAKDEVCILNRQPSLHRLNMLGFRIKVSMENVIKIHPLACPGFNADFDGDQMAVYIPISEEAKQEVIDKLLITKNLTNPANKKLSTSPSQDIILGIYSLTSNLFNSLQEKTNYKNKEITESQKIFNECLPEDFEVIDYPVKKKELIKILGTIKDTYPIEIASNVIDNIKKIGFKYATLFGSTLSLDLCDIEESDEIRQELYKPKNNIERLAKVLSDDTLSSLKKKFNYSYMIESGARGSWDQARQIVLTRGFISNFKGVILDVPIKNSLLSGLTEKEFFVSTYGCRKGLLDVALNTGISGYLSRKLIFTCANLKLDEKMVDCGTTDYLLVNVDSERKAKMLIDRYYFKDGSLHKITDDNCLSLIGKKLKIRSPIYCKNENICHVCYGDLHKTISSKYIGIIAAQSLGECNTQLVLRTFHTSGVAHMKNTKEVNMIQQDIVGDLSETSKLMHDTSKTDAETLVSRLFEIYNSNRKIHHVHFECVVSQLMWSDKLKKWRLLKDRENHKPVFYSIQSVPSHESWLLGLAFSNPRKNILRGIIYSGEYRGILDKILCGEIL